MPPQPSAIEPQLAPAAAHVVGVQPHTFGVPPPPHVWGAVQEPQRSVPPQRSGIEPQLAPAAVHVVGVQAPASPAPVPQTFTVPPPPHVCGAVQEPQRSVPPQPSEIDPQFAPAAAHVVSVQPQAPALPPPPQV
jgi:hypothetical protein